jgi:hypothetical protein
VISTETAFARKLGRFFSLSVGLATPVGRRDLLGERAYCLRMAERTSGGTTCRQCIVRWSNHDGSFKISRTDRSVSAGVAARVKLDGMQVSSVMAFEARARDIEEIPWIAMLGWYIAAQLHRDTALRG